MNRRVQIVAGPDDSWTKTPGEPRTEPRVFGSEGLFLWAVVRTDLRVATSPRGMDVRL